MKSPIRYCIGIDEVGRGPLAGPLCVGACLIVGRSRHSRVFRGVKDSKQLTPLVRQEWFGKISAWKQEGTCRFASVFVGEKTIDRRGLSASLRLAVYRVLRKLDVSSTQCRVLLDGSLYAPKRFFNQETIIRGDESEPLIALASIVAKVRRDKRMERLAKKFPQYGFDVHKGYGTREHYKALRKYGITPIHRRSFLKNFAGTINR
ncbi:MAG: ribonuclease HII [bacterium]|nr:ribonuclease HII [bacterium]